MRRAGGWVLGMLVVAGMAAAAFIGLRPIFFRPKLTICYLTTNRQENLSNGVQLAFDERRHRAGRFDVTPEYLGANDAFPQDRSLGKIAPNDLEWAILQPSDSPISGEVQYVCAVPLNSLMGHQAAQWAHRKGLERALLIDEYSGSSSFSLGFKEEAGLAQVTCLSSYGWPEGMSLIHHIQQSRPDLIVLDTSRPRPMIDALAQAKFPGKILLVGGRSGTVSSLEKNDPPDQIFLLSPFSPAHSIFVRDFQAANAATPGQLIGISPTESDYLGYLSTRLLLDAVEETGARDALTIFRACARRPAIRIYGEFATGPASLYVSKDGIAEFVESVP